MSNSLSQVDINTIAKEETIISGLLNALTIAPILNNKVLIGGIYVSGSQYGPIYSLAKKCFNIESYIKGTLLLPIEENSIKVSYGKFDIYYVRKIQHTLDCHVGRPDGWCSTFNRFILGVDRETKLVFLRIEDTFCENDSEAVYLLMCICFILFQKHTNNIICQLPDLEAIESDDDSFVQSELSCLDQLTNEIKEIDEEEKRLKERLLILVKSKQIAEEKHYATKNNVAFLLCMP
ncbi:MAG: hypothetical protein Barrevirus29_5 [Barrevirus sp.]|uniref:Uncharacterized protein n=1 Tax=Barrevirus sp. TaxID=2487763 RepID=A0A3G4ZQW7_9VIRU|nr:MAG: hypothetical protein Barrevirus29_5 [Barrevirus sp.]